MIANTAPTKASAHGWQLILADLALILFLLALSAQLAMREEDPDTLTAIAERHKMRPAGTKAVNVAPAQAIFRSVPQGPSLGEWLSAQPRDPRATLTIFASHRPGAEAAAWTAARMLAEEAARLRVPTRIIISAGRESEVYASLAYDTIQPN